MWRERTTQNTKLVSLSFANMNKEYKIKALTFGDVWWTEQKYNFHTKQCVSPNPFSSVLSVNSLYSLSSLFIFSVTSLPLLILSLSSFSAVNYLGCFTFGFFLW